MCATLLPEHSHPAPGCNRHSVRADAPSSRSAGGQNRASTGLALPTPTSTSVPARESCLFRAARLRLGRSTRGQSSDFSLRAGPSCQFPGPCPGQDPSPLPSGRYVRKSVRPSGRPDARGTIGRRHVQKTGSCPGSSIPWLPYATAPPSWGRWRSSGTRGRRIFCVRAVCRSAGSSDRPFPFPSVTRAAKSRTTFAHRGNARLCQKRQARGRTLRIKIGAHKKEPDFSDPFSILPGNRNSHRPPRSADISCPNRGRT